MCRWTQPPTPVRDKMSYANRRCTIEQFVEKGADSVITQQDGRKKKNMDFNVQQAEPMCCLCELFCKQPQATSISEYSGHRQFFIRLLGYTLPDGETHVFE